MTFRIGRLRTTVSIASSVVNATTWDLPDSIHWPRTAGFHGDSRGVHIKTNGNQNATAQTTQTPSVIEVAQWTDVLTFVQNNMSGCGDLNVSKA